MGSLICSLVKSPLSMSVHTDIDRARGNARSICDRHSGDDIWDFLAMRV